MHDPRLGRPHPQDVADVLAIQDLLYAYADGIDGRDWELVSSIFTEDAQLDYLGSGGPSGTRDEVLTWIEHMLTPLGYTQHALCNVRVRVDGDTAHAVSQLLNPLLLQRDVEDSETVFLGGRYVDRLRREDGAWRIEQRVHAMDWQTTLKATSMDGAMRRRPWPGEAEG